MDLKFEIGRSISHIANFYFIIVCIFGQTSLVLVSSEDISNIPLSLYQTDLLDTSNALDSLDRKIGDSYKRGSSKAFYGLRGKKLSEPFEEGVETEKRKSSFYPLRGKKKTAAFTALRGKKVYNLEVLNNDGYSNGEMDHSLQNGDDSTPYPIFSNLKGDDYNWRSTITNGNRNLDSVTETRGTSTDQLQMPNGDSQVYDEHSTDKRRSVFVPMRGRKSDGTSDDEKRGTSFFPMRGKKTTSDEDDINTFLDKRLSSGFFPMRGRKSYLDALKQFPQNKRRSTFIPMRGRKSQMTNEWPENTKDTDFQKKSLGFLPMRGRRSSLGAYSVEDAYYHQPNVADMWSRLSSSEDKRATFHALRGKKKNPLPVDWDFPKRAFYALRGKRSDDVNKVGRSSENASNNDLNSAAVDVPTSSEESKARVKRNLLKQVNRGTSRTAPESDRLHFSPPEVNASMTS